MKAKISDTKRNRKEMSCLLSQRCMETTEMKMSEKARSWFHIVIEWLESSLDWLDNVEFWESSLWRMTPDGARPFVGVAVPLFPWPLLRGVEGEFGPVEAKCGSGGSWMVKINTCRVGTSVGQSDRFYFSQYSGMTESVGSILQLCKGMTVIS